MLEKRRLGWMFAWGAALWMITLMLGMWLSPQSVRLYWRGGSEILWLGLGIVYAVMYGERILKLEWKVLVVDVLVFMFGVIVVWVLGLVLVSVVFSSIDPLGSLKEVANNFSILRPSQSLVGQGVTVMREVFRLWIVAMAPVVVRKIVGRRI